jgi:hypothetical protein
MLVSPEGLVHSRNSALKETAAAMQIHANTTRSAIVVRNACAIAVLLLSFSAIGWASEEAILKFNGSNGANPTGNLVRDSVGNLYGVTTSGGGEGGTNCSDNYGCGTVFKLALNSSGHWIQTVLHRFRGIDGMWPNSVIVGPDGNLYGTTTVGGGLGGTTCERNTGCGVVFKLVPTSTGPWTETVLYAFNGADGSIPNALAFDASGNLFGTTLGEGGGGVTACAPAGGCGVLFELTPNSSGPWTLINVHVFVDAFTDAQGPEGLIFGPGGVIYGMGASGGSAGAGSSDGAVFQLTPGASGWTFSLIYSFDLTDGAYSTAGLILDSEGNLYGTTAEGGSDRAGVVFELSPGSGGGVWAENVLYNFFPGVDGYQPNTSLTFDAAGNLYGTTLDGGGSSTKCTNGCGTVFKLTSSGAGTWTESVALRFLDTNGVHPLGGLVADTAGNLYGTASQGGTANLGLVFKLMP